MASGQLPFLGLDDAREFLRRMRLAQIGIEYHAHIAQHIPIQSAYQIEVDFKRQVLHGSVHGPSPNGQVLIY